ncbi:MAG TPA: AgmX/PglI C-terminal domain-containing protein, partial [Polyangiaceae bacterium]|nr:AgmX/PglI C-terminal domain-containing protein [Polyangiaceae bacterium]
TCLGIRTCLLIAALTMSCGPLPESTKVGPAGKRADNVDSPNDIDQIDDGYYNLGTLEVGLGRDYAIVNGRKVPLAGNGGLADALRPTRFLSWQLSFRDDATGRDLIAALKAGVDADFNNVLFEGLDENQRIVAGYAKPQWRKMQWVIPGPTIEITQSEVRVTEQHTERAQVPTAEISSKFATAFDKVCSQEAYNTAVFPSLCDNAVVAIDDDVAGKAIMDVLSAVAPRVGTIMVTATVDLRATMSRVEKIEKMKGTGRLPPEVIQRIVRQNYAAFRTCYEKGLARNANLEGMVIAKFVIESDGKVRKVTWLPRPKKKTSPRPDSPGTTLPDRKVIDCIINGYKSLEFPQPEGGIVTVVYPIRFSPG